MQDYTLAIGDLSLYGFSSGTDEEAIRHAAAYITSHHAAELKNNPDAIVTLGGPNGSLTRSTERLAEFIQRLANADLADNTDDVELASPTPPDCNTA